MTLSFVAISVLFIFYIRVSFLMVFFLLLFCIYLFHNDCMILFFFSFKWHVPFYSFVGRELLSLPPPTSLALSPVFYKMVPQQRPPSASAFCPWCVSWHWRYKQCQSLAFCCLGISNSFIGGFLLVRIFDSWYSALHNITRLWACTCIPVFRSICWFCILD